MMPGSSPLLVAYSVTTGLAWLMSMFSKWAEAVPLREVKTDNVINFLERHIIYR
jgi:hypothetical protein